MKTKLIKIIRVNVIVCLTLNFFAAAVSSAGNPMRQEGERQTQPLTNQQKAQVKSILSKYNATSLTADDAKAIHRAFREAGLPGGPQLNNVVKEAGFDPQVLRDLDPPAGGQRQGGPRGNQRGLNTENRGGQQADKYSLEQAISDNAQLHTIAFSGMAFLTGDFGACTFIPPGKVCDFFGFQYMRDIDAAQKGHNPMFLDRVAGNIMQLLNANQKQIFLDLADKQTGELEQLAKMRLPLIKAFCMQRDNQIPAGSTGLNKDAVTKYVGDIFAYDAQLSLERAEGMAKVYLSLTPDQKTYLSKMKFGDFSTWPQVDEREALRNQGRGKPQLFNVAYMTYASEFFSWIAGTVEADTYFCPERHGTYFGGFYMKDMPAMGKRDFDISTSVTGDSGQAFLEDVLTVQQRTLITEIANKQRNLLNETITIRKNISQELRKLLDGKTPDKEKILSLGRRYGELDGEMSWLYATAFAKVNQTLTQEQKTALMKLRNLEGYQSAPYYIYSSPAKDQPVLTNVDVFFFSPKTTQSPAANPTSSESASVPVKDKEGFTLRSPEVADGGTLPTDFTGDSTSSTLPLEWSGAPDTARSFAVIMHHIDPEGKTKWYWILYNVPADTRKLPKNVKNIGTLGSNSINGRAEYAPPHSQGFGPKTYIYTIYALSSQLKIDVQPAEISRDVLLAAMKDKILASAQLSVTYSRDVQVNTAGQRISVND